MTPHEAAINACRAGLCVMPPRQDGSKAPDHHAWKKYQNRLATESEINGWYAAQRTGVGYFTGKVSGGLECIDFDDRSALAEFERLVVEAGLDGLWESVKDGYFEHSPNGAHVLYRCQEIAGNTKLAKNKANKALIETRGEGGYIIVAPSHGSVNADGSYEFVSGGVDSIVAIEPEDRAALHRVARMLDESTTPVEHSTAPKGHDANRPGDDFGAKAGWGQILEPHGWVKVSARLGVVSWRRPGKEFGISATTGYADSDLLYVFSTSTCFESERGYSKFGAYALLDHGGDFSAASSALRLQGYGLPEPPREAPVDLSGIYRQMDRALHPDRGEPKIQDLLRVPGLVGDLADWINETSHKPQPILALGASLCAVATVLGRKVRTASGLRTNIYVLGVAGSGSGKEASRVSIKRLFAKLGGDGRLGGMFASDASIETAVRTSPSCLYLIDEMGMYLGSITDRNASSHHQSIVRTLLEMYTSSSSAFSYRSYADADRNDKEPINQPCLSIYGTTVPGNFYGSLAKKNSSDGLLGRLLVFESDNPDPELMDIDEDESVPGAILDGFKHWDSAPVNQSPTGNLDNLRPNPLVARETKSAKAVFLRLEQRMRDIRCRVRLDGGDDAPYMRVQATAKKLALIRACGIKLTSPEITEDDAIWGADLAWCLTRDFLARVGDRVVENKTEDNIRRVAELFTKVDQLTKAQYTRKTQWLERRQRDDILATLIESGVVRPVDTKSLSGRQVVAYTSTLQNASK